MSETAATKPIDTKKTRAKLKKRHLIAGLIVLLAVGVACWFGFGLLQKPQDWRKNTATVSRGSIDVHIIATGTIRPINEIKVSPKSTGLIKQLYVKQGDKVSTGQILAQMDASNMVGQLETARGAYQMANDNYLKLVHGNRPQEVAIAKFQEHRAKDIVRQAQQNIIRLKSQIESLTQQAIRDDSMADRQRYLDEQGVISDQDRLNAETQSKMTHAQLEAARRELGQAEGTLAQNRSELEAAQQQHELSSIGARKEDIAAAQDAVLQAKGSLDTLQSQISDMTIKAPFAGVITQKYADSGAIVTPTTSAATTSATSSSIVALASELEMVAEVAETDIGKIRIGQPVEIISNAFPEYSFHGRVTQIAPEAVVTQNVTTFEVHTSIDDEGTLSQPSGEDGAGRHRRHHRHDGDDAAAGAASAKSGDDTRADQAAAKTSQQSGAPSMAAAKPAEQNGAPSMAAAKPAEQNGAPNTAGAKPNSLAANDGENTDQHQRQEEGHHRHRHNREGGDGAESPGIKPHLLSGMNVSARFVAGKLDNTLLVPTVCIMSKHSKTGVLLAEPDGTPKFTPVKTGPTVGTNTAVLHGLKDGDLVFLGLSKDQLEQQGYGDGKGGGRGGGGEGRGGRGGGGGGAPIPRSFGH